MDPVKGDRKALFQDYSPGRTYPDPEQQSKNGDFEEDVFEIAFPKYHPEPEANSSTCGAQGDNDIDETKVPVGLQCQFYWWIYRTQHDNLHKSTLGTLQESDFFIA